MRCEKWCNSFVLVPKANSKVWLCLYPAMHNKALIRLVHRGPTLNDILCRLGGIKYLIIIDISCSHHNLKLDRHSSDLTTSCCQFSRYRYIQLSFGMTPASDTFERKIEELFKGLVNIFGITENIWIAGFNDLGRDHDVK